jgi:N-acetylneuraminic acid mutarotase
MKKIFTLLVALAFFQASAQWTAQANIPIARNQHGIVSHPNGNIYLMTGSNTSGESNSLYIYNVALNTWTTGPNAPFSTRGPSYCLGSDNRVYLKGGVNAGPSLAAYDPALSTWTILANSPNQGWEGAMDCYNGRIYMAGGEGYESNFSIYDIATNTWAAGPSLPVGVLQHKTVSDNSGNIYVIGGRISSTTGTTTVQRYNIATGTWSIMASVPAVRNQFGSCLGPDGLIYVIGGKDSYFNNSSPYFNEVYVFNPCSNSWTATTSHPVAHGELAAATVSNGIFAMGGTNNTGLTQNYFLPVTPSSLSFPSLSLTPQSNVLCANTQVTLEVSGANTYTWNTSANSSSIIITPTANVSYTVSGTNTVGCTSTLVKSFTVNAQPTIAITGASGTICAGSSVSLTAAGADTYTWNTSSTNTSIVVSPNSTSTYTVQGTGANGCSNASTISVNVAPSPSLTLNPSSSILCLGNTATLTAGGADTYTWNTASNNSAIVVSPTVTTSYTVEGTTSSGCSATATITLVVSNCTGINELSGNRIHVLAYPNPNNGSFMVESTETCKLSVYNALGQLQQTLELNEYNHFKVQVQNLPAGIHFISNANKTLQLKVVVTK